MNEVPTTPAYEHRTEQLPDWRTPEFHARVETLVDKVRAEAAGWQPVGVITSMETNWAYVVFERPGA